MSCFHSRPSYLQFLVGIYAKNLDAGFRPGTRAIAWRIPEGATFVVGAKVAKTIFARPRPRWGIFVPAQIMMASNSLRSDRLASELDLARDSAAPKAGILSSVVIPAGC